VFASVDQLKQDLGGAGRDVIDLGFGNPDISSPEIAVEKLREALNPRNHRYSASAVIRQLRQAICEHYKTQLRREARSGAARDHHDRRQRRAHTPHVDARRPERHRARTHPHLPIHQIAPRLAGATVHTYPVDSGFDAIAAAVSRCRPRVLLVSYPHNPTTSVATADAMQRLVNLAREHNFLLVHDFAYADICFEAGHQPSILAAEGALECTVELYSLTKSFSMAGSRMGFLLLASP
jgi:alanine-synthesizing transaminase